MPCMNSTSASERGGRVALVDDGSVLLGAPGAPGCTTTGFAGSLCRARAAGEMIIPKTLAPSNARITTRTKPGWGFRSRRKQLCLLFGVRGKIFIRPGLILSRNRNFFKEEKKRKKCESIYR